MDAAEAWLAANDPIYDHARKTWRNLTEDGDYQTPWQEIPWGSSADLARIVETGRGKFVTDIERRKCDQCDTHFVPTSSIHIHCSDLCREKARKKRNRKRDSYMRDYRSRIKEAA